MLKRLFNEPLVHFVGLAMLIFAVYGLFNGAETEKPERIVVGPPKIEQLAAVFAKAWLRPPSRDELKALVDDYVKQEIYVREALALGLDKDDSVIRLRLRLKMEFLNEAEAELPATTDADLETYFAAHAAKFAIEPTMAFEQIYLDPERRGGRIARDAEAIIEASLSHAATDPAAFGDVTLLPPKLPLTPKPTISQIFGQEYT
jgi:hypothetical protein